MKTSTTNPTIATRRTFDGIPVNLHTDGSVSTTFFRIAGGRLAAAVMWRVFEDVCLYTYAELPALIRAAKGGTRRPFA